MATKLKVVEDVADIVPAPSIPDFVSAPTRKRNVGWTAERQRIFIERVALTGNVGEACALVGLSSSSFYRLCQKPGAEGFVRAWNAARVLAATRGSAIAWDRATRGRVERFYKDGELVMVRRIPSDYLLTWLLSRLDPVTFGSPRRRRSRSPAATPWTGPQGAAAADGRLHRRAARGMRVRRKRTYRRVAGRGERRPCRDQRLIP